MQSKLKIIHFSTGHLGGAGLAARRLNQALNQRGLDSTFIAFEQNSFHPSEHEVSFHRSTTVKFLSKLVTYIDLRLSKKVFFSLFNRDSLKLNYFTQYKEKNTILHFHNFFNLASEQTILELSNNGYNVVVTLHDQRFFTGGCHYAFECKAFESSCANCPQVPGALRPLVTRKKRLSKKLATRSTGLSLIAPSRWIQEAAIKSRIGSPNQIEFIPNTLGPDFLPNFNNPSNLSRTGSYVLGIASMDTNSFIKGSDLVDKLRIEARENQFPLEFISMKDFSGIGAAEKFWESIDCLLVLSRADNSPNVIHEAKSLGIPIIANPLGGITEMLDPEFDFFVPNIGLSLHQIHTFLNGLSSCEDFGGKQSRMIEKFHDYVNLSIEGHVNLYESIVESR